MLVRVKCKICTGEQWAFKGSPAAEQKICSGCHYMDRPTAKEVQQAVRLNAKPSGSNPEVEG